LKKRLEKWLWGISILTAIIFLGYQLWLSSNTDANVVNSRLLKHFWDGVGNYSIGISIGAIILWIAKKIVLNGKKENPKTFTNIGGKGILFLRQNHIFLGWFAFLLALTHSIYFLIRPLSHIKYTYTGIVAICIMTVLILVGILYQYKHLPIKTARKWHMALSVLFGIIMVTHI